MTQKLLRFVDAFRLTPVMVLGLAACQLLAPRAAWTQSAAHHAPSSSVSGLSAGASLAAVTGVVRDTAGAPQIGALVQLLGPDFQILGETFTDDRGRYTLPGVRAGLYQLKASGSLYLPTLREHLELAANSRLVVNLTLNTFYEAVRWLPAEPRRADESRDDWAWTLRLSANRPLLRVLGDGGSAVLVTGEGADDARRARVTVRSGLNRFGEGGMHQDVELERANDDARQLILRADVAQDVSRIDGASLRTTAAWRQQMAPGRAVVGVASFVDRPEIVAGDGGHIASSAPTQGFGSLTVRSAETMDFGPDTHVEVGTELQAVHLGRLITASHPFASVAHQFGGNTLVYRAATSPGAQQAASLDRDSTLTPSVTEHDGALQIEQGLHQELSFERQSGNWTGSVAYFHDRMEHPLVSGGVAVDHDRTSLSAADGNSGDLVYDPATELIAVSGQSYSASGILAELRDQITPGTWLSLSYGAGQAVTLEDGGRSEPRTASKASNIAGNTAGAAGTSSLASGLAALQPTEAQMIAAVLGGHLGHHPDSATEWRASYRWQPDGTLTQVAPFSTSLPDAYLSFYLRQPIRLRRGAASRMQAILDVRNLLAQGYRPFLSQDGSTLYFAQAERCVEGGFSFSF